MPKRAAPQQIDDLNHILYRLDQLKNPDPRIRKQLLEEIQRCKDLSAADPSTNARAPGASTRNPSSPKQRTLEL